MKLNPTNSSIVKRLLSGRNSRPLKSILTKIEPADLATLLTQYGTRDLNLLTDALLTINKAHSSFMEVPESQLQNLFKKLSKESLIKLILVSPEKNAAYFLSQLDENTRAESLENLDEEKKGKLNQLLSYPENSAGQLMQTNFFCVPTNFTAKQGLELLREKAQEQSIYYIYSTNEHQVLEGVVSLRALAIAKEDTPLSDIVKRDIITVFPETTEEEVAQIASRYDFIAIPVTDKNRRLLGIITIDEVMDILQEQATANIYASAGLREDDRIYSSNWFKIKNRMPWMILNLFLAACASSVVSLFEETMSTLIVLASLKNIVAGMSGNTAIQSLTVVTRGLATGDFKFVTHVKTVLKESTVGITIGFLTGLMASVLVYFWKGDLMVATVIFISMFINSFIAAFVGSFVPILLNKLNKDPAVGSGVIVTMITDIFSFFSFLGIATLALKYI